MAAPALHAANAMQVRRHVLWAAEQIAQAREQFAARPQLVGYSISRMDESLDSLANWKPFQKSIVSSGLRTGHAGSSSPSTFPRLLPDDDVDSGYSGSPNNILEPTSEGFSKPASFFIGSLWPAASVFYEPPIPENLQNIPENPPIGVSRVTTENGRQDNAGESQDTPITALYRQKEEEIKVLTRYGQARSKRVQMKRVQMKRLHMEMLQSKMSGRQPDLDHGREEEEEEEEEEKVLRQPQHDHGNGDRPVKEHIHDSGAVGIIRWVDATEHTSFLSSPSVIQEVTTSVDSSPAATTLPLTPKDLSAGSSRELLLELSQVLEGSDIGHDACTPAQADTVPSDWTYDADSPLTTTPTSDASDSPDSSTSPSSSPLEVGSKTTVSSSGSGQERDGSDDGPPRKKRNRDQESIIFDAWQPSSCANQMPCPFLELDGCQGTNPTISELMRSLANRHRKIICKDCCKLLSVPEGEKKPLNVLQKHASERCEPRCIGTSCSTEPADNAPYHRRTEKCPTWQTLTKEDRWKFIWMLINPESDPPVPNFQQGPGFEHSTQRRLCKQQPRARVNEICADLWRNNEAKEKRISTLEHELSMSNEYSKQMQQKYDDKVGNLENIIETLLEHLSDKAIDVPRALRRRLRQECPTILVDEPAILKPSATKMAPIPHVSQPLMPLPQGFSAPFSPQSIPWPPPSPPRFYNAHPQQLVDSGNIYHNPQMSMEINTGYQTGVGGTAWSPHEFHQMWNNAAWGQQPQLQNAFEGGSLENGT
ncbi:hypothetical protein DDE83_003682 [Stemphylium lycopersici]|uniref:Uncharacterized protein n=1 Tax=Stemphylium lycopersici TaxID=183478 RepID=A0A364N6X2_STELY|nr:hypothetical protein DDE83_003682 [Stemphylium lycopersici]